MDVVILFPEGAGIRLNSESGSTIKGIEGFVDRPDLAPIRIRAASCSQDSALLKGHTRIQLAQVKWWFTVSGGISSAGRLVL